MPKQRLSLPLCVAGARGAEFGRSGGENTAACRRQVSQAWQAEAPCPVAFRQAQDAAQAPASPEHTWTCRWNPSRISQTGCCSPVGGHLLCTPVSARSQTSSLGFGPFEDCPPPLLSAALAGPVQDER